MFLIGIIFRPEGKVCLCPRCVRCWRHSLNSAWIVSKRPIVKRSFGGCSRVHIADKHGLPLAEEGDTHVSQLWFARDPTTTAVSSKLKGAPEGPERQKLWDELQKFIIVEGKEEGDDDDMDKDDQS